MSLPNFSNLLLSALVAFTGVCFAQTSRSDSGAVAGMAAQPLDLRVGVFRPTDPGAQAPGDTAAANKPGNAKLGLALQPIAKDYRVGPNDLIDVEVLDLDNLKRTVRVNTAGAISLPLIGTVLVAGLTTQEVETRIAQRYGQKYLQNPQVSIFIKEFTTERITVEGAVMRPGIYPLTGRITLLRALALAGGFGQIANSSEVMLFRVSEDGARQVAVFDIEQIRAGKHEDPAIRGDDLIVVQRDATRKMLKDSLFRDILDSVNPFSVFSH